MFNLLIIFTVAVAAANSAPVFVPSPVLAAPLTYTAPVAPGFVTSSTSQVISRNFHGLAAPYVAAAPAPIVASYPGANAGASAAASASSPGIARDNFVAAPLPIVVPLRTAVPIVPTRYIGTPYLAAPYSVLPAIL